MTEYIEPSLKDHQLNLPTPVDEGAFSAETRARANTTHDAAVVSPWTARHFTPLITRSGAVKLAASAVAPLVAVARGYESVDASSAKDFAKRWAVGDGRSKRGTQFLSCFRDDGDVLVMPWYSGEMTPATVGQMTKPTPSGIQIRPENPRMNEKGKPVKYEFLVGQDTVVDRHPATTREFAASARRVMIAEGLLKGDSALTALLRQHVDEAELQAGPGDLDRVAAMERLATLMEKIPAHDRVLILNVAGVGNWRSNPEWNAIDLREREVLIAFDGDVANNWSVWEMARQLMQFVEQSKKATPLLVDIARFPGIEAVLATEPHLGLDDFLHHVGTWTDIHSMITDSLPERPDRGDDNKVGEWRVSKEGTSVEECVQDVDAQGNKTPAYWKTRYNLGGRLKYVETRREPTEDEIRTAVFGAGVDTYSLDANCVVELSWLDTTTDQVVTADVSGPQTILGYPPAEWDRRGASIDGRILRHPEWPPKKGLEWLKAVKSHEAERAEDRTVWSEMGWVPVEGESVPAFIVGDSIIAISEEAASRTRIGVTGRELNGASSFGVSDVYTGPGLSDPTGVHSLADDIETVLEVLIERGPWRSKQTAVTMLALALRPTIPVQTSVSSYFVGPAGKGKSWSARQIMSFWQKRPGTWELTLPGSAADTYASTEFAVARTPIWVADDLAPTSDKRAAEKMESDIGGLIRAVFNKLGKRRMNSDMTAKEVPTPKAVLILTAENEHSIQSIRERVVKIEFSGLKDENYDRAEKMANRELVAARVTAAVLRMLIQLGEREGWESLLNDIHWELDNGVSQSREILAELGMDSDIERPARMVADLSLGLLALSLLAREIGREDLTKSIHWRLGGYSYLLAEQVASGHLDKRTMAPGQALLDGIRTALSSGLAHIGNHDTPEWPPLMNGSNPDRANISLGWRVMPGTNDWAPQGRAIGRATTDAAGHTTIWFNPQPAFHAAKRGNSVGILNGARPRTYWLNVWDLGLQAAHYDVPDKGQYTRQKRGLAGGEHAVPMDLTTLLEMGQEDN